MSDCSTRAWNVWARRQTVHSTPDSAYTMCDGCAELECIEQDRSRLHPWRYYCCQLHREIEYKELFRMTERDCPLGGKR